MIVNTLPSEVDLYILRMVDLVLNHNEPALKRLENHLLSQELKKYYSENPIVKIAMFLRAAGSKVLAENPKISNPYPNVDAISGVVLTAAGFGYAEYIAVLFGMSRIVGIARQIVYERCEARDGKGTPIVRPKYLYAGDKSVSG